MPVGPYLERVSLETLCKARHRLIPGTGLADNGEGRGGPRDISASYLDAIGLARLVHVGTGSGSGHAPAVGGLLAHIAEGSLGLAAEGGAGEHAVDKTPRSGGQGEWLSRRKGGQWGGEVMVVAGGSQHRELLPIGRDTRQGRIVFGFGSNIQSNVRLTEKVG